STSPWPVTTPSAGNPVASALASCPSSTKVSASNSSAMRSRTYSLLAAASLAAARSGGSSVASRAAAISLPVTRSPCHDGRRRSRDRQAETAGDDQALHFGRAFADLQDLGVTVEPGHRELLHEAVPAED